MTKWIAGISGTTYRNAATFPILPPVIIFANKLWLNVGGSIGFSSLWALDCNEGKLQEDFSGLRWDVEVRLGHEERAGQKTESQLLSRGSELQLRMVA